MLKAARTLFLVLIAACCIGTGISAHALADAKEKTRCKFLYDWWWIEHSAEPVNTERNGGESSYENPSIRVKQESCMLGHRAEYEKIIAAGESINIGRPGSKFTYVARICADPSVCKNRCAYGCCTPPFEVCTNCTGTDCKPPCSENVECDPSITSITTYGCQNPQEIYPFGICAYSSDYSTNLTGFLDFFRAGGDIFTTVKQAEDSAKALGVAECKSIYGFTQINSGCFPVPIAPLPPPFGLGPIPLISQVRLHKICSYDELEDGRPTTLLSDYLTRSAKFCVLPIEKYSTYSRPCVRITFDKNQAFTNEQRLGLTLDPNASFIKIGDNTYEQLYEFTITINSAVPIKEISYIVRSGIIKDDINTQDIQFQQPTLYGYNDSPYKDLCATVNLDGTFNSEYVTIRDPGSELDRTFGLTVKAEQVCVAEESHSGKVERGCVPRPNMKQPIAEFCTDSDDQAVNDQSNSCLQIRLPDFEDSDKQGYTYRFRGSPSKCTDIQQEDSDGIDTKPRTICLINSEQEKGRENNFGFRAISTNDCYVNTIYGLNSGSSDSCPKKSSDDFCSCIKSVDPCSCSNSDDLCMKQCEACNFDQMCYNEDKKTIKGVTKLCLYGYTDTYAALISGNDTNCNTVCAKLMPSTQGWIPDQTSGERDGDNNQAPGIAACSTCPPTETIERPPFLNRVKNPVEAGLCVDVYPFSFIDCTQMDGRSAFICNILQQFCRAHMPDQSSDTQSGPVQQYKNFAECIDVFNVCRKAKPTDLLQDAFEALGKSMPPALLSAMTESMEGLTCAIINSFITVL